MKALLLFLALLPSILFADNASILTTPAPLPSSSDFLEIAPPVWLSDEPVEFQHGKHRLRKLTIRGAEIEIDLEDRDAAITQAILGSSESYPLDLKELHIHAIKLTFRGPVWLPGTDVYVDAGEVVFADDDRRTAQLITTPLPYEEDAGQQEVTLVDFVKRHPDVHDAWYLRNELTGMIYEVNYDFMNITGDSESVSRPDQQRLRPAQSWHEHFLPVESNALRTIRKQGPVAIEDLDFGAAPEESNQLGIFINYLHSFANKRSPFFNSGTGPHNGSSMKRYAWSLRPSARPGTVQPPRYWPNTLIAGNDGGDGLPAGSIQASIAKLVAPGTIPRFILQGGDGQDAGATEACEIPTSLQLYQNEPEHRFDPKKGPLFSYQGLPVLIPSLFQDGKMGEQPLTNEWILQGQDGAPHGRPGQAGPAGTLTVASSEPNTFFERSILEPGVPGKPVESQPGGAPILEKWYEIRILGTEEDPDPGQPLFVYPGMLSPDYDEEAFEAYQAAERAYLDKLDAEEERFKREKALAIKQGKPVPHMNIIPRNLPPKPVKWHVPPYRFQLELKEGKSGTDMTSPELEPLPEDSAGERIATDFADPDSKSLRLALDWARELYLRGYTFEATEACLTMLERYGAIESTDPLVADQLAELSLMTRRLASGQDYFGKPPGWAPSASLELMLRSYEQTVDQAVRTLVMAAYLENAWDKQADRANRRDAMISHFDAQRTASQVEMRHLETLLADLEKEMEYSLTNLDTLIEALKDAETRIVEDVALREEFRHELLRSTAAIGKFTENFAGVSADAFSELGAIGSFLGLAGDVTNSTVSAMAESLRFDLERMPRIPEHQISSYFERMLEEEKVKEARRDLQELDPRKHRSDALLAKLSKLVKPLAAATTRATQDQMRVQLERTEEGRRLYDVLFTERDPYAGFANGGLQFYAAVVDYLDEQEAELDIEIINPRVPQKLAQFRNHIHTADFKQLFAQMNLQFTFRGALESKILHTKLLLKANEDRLGILQTSIKGLEDEAAGKVAPQALSETMLRSLQTMRRDAEERLLYQKYCLIQAYHYRILKSCEFQDPVRGYRIPARVSQLEAQLHTDFLMQAVFRPGDTDERLKRSLGEDWADYLEGGTTLELSTLDEVIDQVRVIHEESLSRIVRTLKDELLRRSKADVEPRRIELTAEDLEILNRYGELTLDLEDRYLLFPKDQNARLIAVHFVQPSIGGDAPEFGTATTTTPDGPDPKFANLKVTCELGSYCEFKWGSNRYAFVHSSDEDSQETIASFTYNTAGGTVHASKPLASDSTLLLDVFGIPVSEGELRQLKTYRGARTTMTLRKQMSHPGVEIPIAKLVLWIEVASNVGPKG